MTEALVAHLALCRRARGRWFFLLMVCDSVAAFMAVRVVTVLAAAIVAWLLLLSLR